MTLPFIIELGTFKAKKVVLHLFSLIIMQGLKLIQMIFCQQENIDFTCYNTINSVLNKDQNHYYFDLVL